MTLNRPEVHNAFNAELIGDEVSGGKMSISGDVFGWFTIRSLSVAVWIMALA